MAMTLTVDKRGQGICICVRASLVTTCLPFQRVYLPATPSSSSLSLFASVLFKMVVLTISTAPKYSARGLPLTIDVTPEATVGDVKAAVAANFSKVHMCCCWVSNE